MRPESGRGRRTSFVGRGERGEVGSLPDHEPNGKADGVRTCLVQVILAVSNLHRRVLAVVCAVAGPRITYAVLGTLGRWLFRLLDPVRQRSETQLQAALGHRFDAGQVKRLAERAFVHRVWSLADLYLAERFLHPGTFHRYGGRIPPHGLRLMQTVRRLGHPVIFVSGYYGPYDLLPVLLGYNGIRAGVVYRPHPNPAFDAFRRRVRGRSGCELIPLERAAVRLSEILAAGGAVALVADHHLTSGGQPATFLGLPTRVPRSVGLLAWRYEAVVVVAGIRRVGDAFHFELVMADLIVPDEWKADPDPVAFITQRYLRGQERIVLADPSQYIWAYARWGDAVTPVATDSCNEQAS